MIADVVIKMIAVVVIKIIKGYKYSLMRNQKAHLALLFELTRLAL